MLYREDATPNEKLAAAGMPAAPDDEYAAEWAGIEVAMRRKYFPADYSTVDHTSRALDESLHLAMLQNRPVTSKLLEAWRRETVELSNIFATAKSGTAPPPAAVKGEPVLGGATHLHREPNVVTKKNLFMHKFPFRSTPVAVPYPIEHRNASVRFEWDNRVKARRDCAAALSHLTSELSQQSFIDYDFFVGEAASLYPPGTSATSTVGEPRDVKSLRKLFPGVPLLGPLGKHVLVPGKCATQHLVTAVDCITVGLESGEAMILDLFVSPEGDCASTSGTNDFFNSNGFIGVLLCVNSRWEWVVVDDLVAVDSHGDLLFMKTVDAEQLVKLSRRYHECKTEEPYLSQIEPCAALWPMLLEKALAKVYGCYDAVDGGIVRETVSTLTGAVEVGSAALNDDLISALQLDSTVTLAIAHADNNSSSYAVQFGPQNSVTLFSSLDIPSMKGTEACLPKNRVVELLRFRPVDDVIIEVCDISSAEKPSEYTMTLTAPICASVMLCVEQSDPRLNMNLPYELRSQLPLCLTNLTVTDSAGRIVSPSTLLPTCRRQVGMVITIEPGTYTVSVDLTGGPAVPFSLSMSCNGCALLSVVRAGHDLAVHGVTTRVAEQRRPPSPPQLVGPVSPRPSRSPQLSPRLAIASAAPPRTPNPGIAAAFNAADILQRGALDERGSRRAFSEYILHHTAFGMKFQQLLRESANVSQENGEALAISLDSFQSMVDEAFTPTHNL